MSVQVAARVPVVRASERLPRDLHPGAWWLWAIALAAAASRTTNPLLLGMIIAVTALVVAARRTDAPWARGLRYFLWLGLAVIAIRVLFRAILGGAGGEHVIITLPSVTLPEAAAGITLGGPVMLESLLAAFCDGLRLATMLICVGAANALANPKRLLKSLPGALYEAGTAVVVALTVAPQLIESVLRVRRSRRLRGGLGRGPRALGSLLMPVLEDALDRSLALAAAMDSRGYGRRGTATRGERLRSGVLVIGGLLGVCAGLYGLLGATGAGRRTGLIVFAAGTLVAALGMVLGGREVHRTRYRPDPWLWPEWTVVGSGVACLAAFLIAAAVDPVSMFMPFLPLAWPALPPVAAAGVLVAALPAVLAPPVAMTLEAVP